MTIVHRRDELRASKIMAGRAISNPRIRFAWNSAVETIHGQDKVTSVTLRDTVTGATRPLQVTGVFVAIGHDPRNELIKGVIDLDAAGHHRRRLGLRRRPGRRTSPPQPRRDTPWTGKHGTSGMRAAS